MKQKINPRPNTYLLGLITSSLKSYPVWIVFLFILTTKNTYSRSQEQFEFSLGDNVQVISDKAFRRTKDNIFEAIGNVIITHRNNAIYCEKATLHFTTGEMKAIGNVRYVGQSMTMYGSRLDYNLSSGYFSAENARILGTGYVILGKKLSRISPEVIIGEDAEYTTCRDCPESWSVFGRKVHITLGEYIRIKHAYIKIRGIITSYVPYVVFPIKKNREMGLLFPKFGYKLKEGFQFQQPWFLPMSQSADLTLTPFVLGKRGWGNDLQVRHIIKEGIWYETNSFQVFDQVYRPGSNSDLESGTTNYRNLTDWEHHFFSGKNFNHHTFLNGVNDLDIVYDIDSQLGDRVSAVDFGGESFFDFRQNWFSLSTESYFQRNGLYEDSKKFDHRYVQILPKVSFSSIPIQIYQSNNKFFNKVRFLAMADHTIFKQNHFEENEFIRNAHRLNATPQLDVGIAKLGPVNLNTIAKLDYQHYRFPYETDQKSFSKVGIVYETEASFSIDKIYGLAYEERIPMKKVILKKVKKKTKKNKDLIGKLPSQIDNYDDQVLSFQKNSFRHRQEYKMKHYFISDQAIKGSDRFESQIQSNKEGQFDDLDAIRDKQTELNSKSAKESLPLANTLELQWNNTLVRKRSVRGDLLRDGHSVRDNFAYENVGNFNISQGLFRSIDDQGEPHYILTRLRIDTRMDLPTSRLSFSEFYYYYTQEHRFNFHYEKDFKFFDVRLGTSYDGFNQPVVKAVYLGTEIRLIERFRFRTQTNYDYDEKRIQGTKYEMLYMPYNNCWRFNISYERNLNDKQVAFNFLINYNKNSFTSTSGK